MNIDVLNSPDDSTAYQFLKQLHYNMNLHDHLIKPLISVKMCLISSVPYKIWQVQICPKHLPKLAQMLQKSEMLPKHCISLANCCRRVACIQTVSQKTKKKLTTQK